VRVAVGLVHYPIRDRMGKVVATNVTNLDVHDIARACRVYGIERYYIIHPMQDQRIFVERMLEHWRVGDGVRYNPMRRTSLTMVHTAESIEDAIRDWGAGQPALVSTHARSLEGVSAIGFQDLRKKLQSEDDEKSMFLLFGTGFGLTEEVMKQCDFLLEPIRGASKDDYRHLSVRSAVSICLDRLFGAW
jgi:hypothetical protein